MLLISLQAVNICSCGSTIVHHGTVMLSFLYTVCLFVDVTLIGWPQEGQNFILQSRVAHFPGIDSDLSPIHPHNRASSPRSCTVIFYLCCEKWLLLRLTHISFSCSYLSTIVVVTECDKACDGCNGDGPDMCNKCAEGYVMDQNMCIGK